MTIAEEYRKSLKLAEAEEILDLIIFRPIAFILVKLIYRLPITPNQVTYGALIAGLIAAFEFAQGTANGFVWGAIWFAIANVLDCGDGMLARLQKSGTPLGRIIDGIVDWVSSVAIFLGLGLGLSAYHNQPMYWLLAIAAGIVSGYHAMVFDKRQQQYISTVRGEQNFIERESQKVELELAHTSNPFRKFFLSAYQRYLSVQEGPKEPKVEIKQYPATLYRAHNRGIMRWWTFLGPTTNRSLLMIAGILTFPEWFCWFVLIPLNLYFMYLILWQGRVTRRLDSAVHSSNLHATSVAG